MGQVENFQIRQPGRAQGRQIGRRSLIGRFRQLDRIIDNRARPRFEFSCDAFIKDALDHFRLFGQLRIALGMDSGAVDAAIDPRDRHTGQLTVGAGQATRAVHHGIKKP